METRRRESHPWDKLTKKLATSQGEREEKGRSKHWGAEKKNPSVGELQILKLPLGGWGEINGVGGVI